MPSAGAQLDIEYLPCDSDLEDDRDRLAKTLTESTAASGGRASLYFPTLLETSDDDVEARVVLTDETNSIFSSSACTSSQEDHEVSSLGSLYASSDASEQDEDASKPLSDTTTSTSAECSTARSRRFTAGSDGRFASPAPRRRTGTKSRLHFASTPPPSSSSKWYSPQLTERYLHRRYVGEELGKSAASSCARALTPSVSEPSEPAIHVLSARNGYAATYEHVLVKQRSGNSLLLLLVNAGGYATMFWSSSTGGAAAAGPGAAAGGDREHHLPSSFSQLLFLFFVYGVFVLKVFAAGGWTAERVHELLCWGTWLRFCEIYSRQWTAVLCVTGVIFAWLTPAEGFDVGLRNTTRAARVKEAFFLGLGLWNLLALGWGAGGG